MYCRRRRTMREFLAGMLVHAAGERRPVAEVIARLRCGRCGEAPFIVTMFCHRHGTAGDPMRELLLAATDDDRRQ